jgi:hypothetical protein
MQSLNVHTISKLFARRSADRSSARQETVLTPTIPDGTPPAVPPVTNAAHGPEMLFIQSFQSGSIAPKAGVEGRYTVTLEHGLGQTIYFSDRPERQVGATPTPQFLQGIGFSADNPPNAALLVETAPGETGIAVVELFNPVYDEASHTATYEIEVLKDWKDSTELGFTTAPADPSQLASNFGTAHLFIDDCPNDEMVCLINDAPDGGWRSAGTIPYTAHDGFCYSWRHAGCFPCKPWFPPNGDSANAPEDSYWYWSARCEDFYPGCGRGCRVDAVCNSGIDSFCR